MIGIEAVPPGADPPIGLIGDRSTAAHLLKPVRLEILRNLEQPDSATGLAPRLGLSRQRLNYHLRQLEEAGLIRLVEERRKGNCTERLYRATARHYLISPAVLGAMAPPDPGSEGRRRARDRFSWSYLLRILGRALRDLATLRRRADRAGQPLATFAIQADVRLASPRKLNELAARLSAVVADLVAEFHDEAVPRGRRYELFVGSYPKITRKGGDDE